MVVTVEDPLHKGKLVQDISERIIAEGSIKNLTVAEQIARTWVCRK